MGRLDREHLDHFYSASSSPLLILGIMSILPCRLIFPLTMHVRHIHVGLVELAKGAGEKKTSAKMSTLEKPSTSQIRYKELIKHAIDDDEDLKTISYNSLFPIQNIARTSATTCRTMTQVIKKYQKKTKS